MKNLARMYRVGGMPPAPPKAPAQSKSPVPPKSDEMLNEEMMPGILNQPETEAERKKREAEKKAAELAKKAEKSAPTIDPDQRKASGGPVYSRGAKVSSASKRADGIAQRGKTRGKIC